VRYRHGRSSLAGLRVAVQGLGNVGFNLAKLLSEAGAGLIVSDVNDAAVEKAVLAFGAEAAGLDAIYDADADVFAPCALGAIVNDLTLPRLRAGIIAGAANDQLATPAHGEALRQRGILYAPDYVINAGGIIQVGAEILGDARDALDQRVRAIGDTLLAVFNAADKEGIATSLAADRIAMGRLRAADQASAA
jgi:leucine dehydrogenase